MNVDGELHNDYNKCQICSKLINYGLVICGQHDCLHFRNVKTLSLECPDKHYELANRFMNSLREMSQVLIFLLPTLEAQDQMTLGTIMMLKPPMVFLNTHIRIEKLNTFSLPSPERKRSRADYE